jgi:hypothetical protein
LQVQEIFKLLAEPVSVQPRQIQAAEAAEAEVASLLFLHPFQAERCPVKLSAQQGEPEE